MSVEREFNYSQEKNRENTVEVGQGHLIQVSSLEKVVYEKDGFGTKEVKKEVPIEELQKAQESLAKLPFSIGEKETERIGTFPRTSHEASIIIGPRPSGHNDPESEQKKRVLIFRFEKGLVADLTFENVKKLGFEHRETKGNMGNVSLIHFEPDETFEVGGEEIAEIRLVIPAEQTPEKKKS